MRVKAFALIVLAAASVAGAAVRSPAISDSVDVKIDEWMTPSKPAYPHDPAVAPDGSIWYTGAARQHDRPLRSGDRTVQGVRAADAELGTARSAGGQRRQHLVHRERRGAHRQGRPEDRQGHRIQDAEPEGPRPAHDCLPAGRPDLLHGPGRQLHRHAGSEGAGRRHQAGRIADRQLAAVRRAPDLEGRPVLRRVQLEQDRQRRSEDAGHHASTRCPNKDARPRRIAIGKDDTVWYGDYARGFLGHLDPKTGKVEEFASPGGPDSKPYAIDVTSDGAIWYVETGDETKNVLVRFNPETKKFLTWPIPSGGGTVRNMEIDKKGDLWLA